MAPSPTRINGACTGNQPGQTHVHGLGELGQLGEAWVELRVQPPVERGRRYPNFRGQFSNLTILRSLFKTFCKGCSVSGLDAQALKRGWLFRLHLGGFRYFSDNVILASISYIFCKARYVNRKQLDSTVVVPLKETVGAEQTAS